MCVWWGVWGGVGITDRRGNVGNVGRTRGQELEDFWPGSGQRSTQGCLSTHIWEDTAEQRFEAGEFKWGRLGSRTSSPGSCGVLTGRGTWRSPTCKTTRTKLTFSLCLPPLRLCSACLQFPPHQFLSLGWFPAPPAFLEPSSSIAPARHIPVSL